MLKSKLKDVKDLVLFWVLNLLKIGKEVCWDIKEHDPLDGLDHTTDELNASRKQLAGHYAR